MDLPEELRFESLSSPAMATLYTNKTQPVSFTQQQVRFEVPRQGIQDSSAYITWSYNSSSFAKTPLSVLGGGANFPMNIGCESQIERAVLSTASGRIIMDNRNFGEKQVIQDVYRDGGYSHFVGRYLNLSNWSWSYCDADDAPGAPAGLEPASAAGCIRPSGEPKTMWGAEDNTGQFWSSPKILRLGGSNAPDVPQVVRTTIQQMFPFLYNVQLPVNIMEQLYIDIYWKQDLTDGDVVAMNTDALYPVGGVPDAVNRADCFYMSSNIVYDDPEVMANILAQQEANGGLAFQYVDDATQVISTPALAAQSIQEYERDLACMNYKICYIKNIELEGQTGDNVKLYGKYYSNGRQTRSLQFALNDANFFPDNDRTQPQNFSLATELYPQGLLYSPRPAYALTGRLVDSAMPPFAGAGDELFNRAPIRTTLAGRNNVYALNLKDDAGTPFQMGNTPIRLYYKRTKTNTGQLDFNNASLSYYFIGYMREFAVLPSGKVVVSEYS